MKRYWHFFLILAVLALLILSCQTLTGLPASTSLPAPATPLPTTPIQFVQATESVPAAPPPAVDLVSQQDTLVRIYEAANPGVVSLRVLTPDGGSQGSGFVFDQEGHILTNYHVVENLTDLEVAFPSGYKTRGTVMGTDLDSDIAVIQVDSPASELHPLHLGDSDQVKVGQTVIAIGNPFGFKGTMTVGIISGLGRSMQSLHEAPGGNGDYFSAGDIIQTDAAINPGNSGGPLLDLNGDVIGINRAIYTTNFSSTGQPVNSGLGFAVSINIIKRVVPALIANGKYDYPYVGITSVSDLTLLEQEALDLPQSVGVYVAEISPGSPADKAGLKAGSQTTSVGLKAGGDLIVAIDGHEVLGFSDFIGYLIKNKSPGDTVVLTVLRGDQNMEVSLTLDKRPGS